MRILILRSRTHPKAERPADAYTQEFSSAFAERVIGNLTGDEGFCTSCGPDCISCRKPYNRRFGREIAGVIALPAVLPYLLEDPGRYVPPDIPRHEIILAVNIHEQMLIEILKRCARRGTRSLVVPVEASDWLSGAARAQVLAICRQSGIEVSFPKPFCSFDPPAGGLLAEFRRRFHIGKPQVELRIKNDRIEEAYVHVSAACGATYYVARWLAGRRIDDDLRHEVIAKRMHSYPCTASMKWDDEIGDTIMHVASQAHYEILAPLDGRVQDDGPEMVASPVGGMIPKPVPPKENIENIEKAKEAILEDLAGGAEVSLASLRKKRKLSPAATHSALLILKQEGKIRTRGGRIVRIFTGPRNA